MGKVTIEFDTIEEADEIEMAHYFRENLYELINNYNLKLD
jgi:hypothetical protein